MCSQGSCELWLDDNRVYQNDDCEAAFGSATPTWTVDWLHCKGNCMLRFFWLGLQSGGTRWQVYKDCVPVAGGGSSSKTPTATTKAPSKSTSTPKPTTKAPSKSKADVGGEGDTSAGAKNGTLSADCKVKRSQGERR